MAIPDAPDKNINVYEIDLSKKYIMQFDGSVPPDSIEETIKSASDWVKDDNPFLFVGPGISLLKIKLDNNE